MTFTAPAPSGTNRLAYNVRGAADVTGLGERTLWRLIAEGKLGPVVRVGHRTIIPATTIAAFLEREAEAVPA